MSASLNSLLASCAALPGGSLMAGLALAGLVGGATHCAAMCSPTLIAVGAVRSGPRGMIALMSGRMITYATLGAASAAFNRLLWSEPLFAAAALFLLGCASLLMVMAALPATRLMVAQGLMQVYRPFAPALYRRINKLRALDDLPRLFLTGLLMGFMPCSMIIAALMAVSATGDPATAALGMSLFVAATTPPLWFAVGTAARLRQRFPAQTRWLEPAAMIISASVMMLHARTLFA